MENNSQRKRYVTPVDLFVNSPTSLRNHERKVVSIRVLCHAHGSFNTVYIFNISRGGAALRGCKSLMVGDIVRLEFLDRRQIKAAVRWWLNGNCGVQFTPEIASDDPLLHDRAGFRYCRP
jgi:PilZ domain